MSIGRRVSNTSDENVHASGSEDPASQLHTTIAGDLSLEAGWYWIEARSADPDSELWLSGTSVDAQELRFRVPLSRHDRQGPRGSVVAVPAGTGELQVTTVDGSREAQVSLVVQRIGRMDALLRMLLAISRRPHGLALAMATAVRMAALVIRGRHEEAGSLLVGRYAASPRPYGFAFDISIPCAVHLGGRRIGGTEFVPIDQLSGRARSRSVIEWEATGDDPKFRLVRHKAPMSLPSGWYTLRIAVGLVTGHVVGPCLYPDYGKGWTHEDRIPLPEPGEDGWIQSLLLLRSGVRDLRFDPSLRQAIFTIGDIELCRIGRLRALWTMLESASSAPDVPAGGTSASPLWAFCRLAVREGVSKAAAALFQGYQERTTRTTGGYESWVRMYDTIAPPQMDMLRLRAQRVHTAPLISVIVPVFETPETWLRGCIESVRGQAYENWELCIADDASTAPHVVRVLEEYARQDERIRYTVRERNGHICAASNTALAMASGQFVALLDHDDELRPHALLEMAEALAADPARKLLYSDEDKIDGQGRRFDPYFKPDWNPDLLLGQNYVCHLTVIDSELVRSVGGFRPGLEGSQDHDLILRCIERLAPAQVHHIPKVLYHWRAIEGSTALRREAKDYAATAGAQAVSDHLVRKGCGARAEELDHGHYRVRWPLPEPAPRVSVIVPTRDRMSLLKSCVESILDSTEYPDFEVLVVDNQSTEPDALAYLDSLRGRPRVRVLRYDHPFNYSAINNWAVAQCRGSVIALLNNDIEVISKDWMREMASQAIRADIGAVGAMLLYPDGSIQHAGVILGLGGIANHAYVHQPGDYPGHGGRARVVQNLSAVTGACLVVERRLYEEIGGLDERLAVAFNDIDFCLRLVERGYRNLWTPFARLHHHESASRGRDESEEKRKRFEGEIAYMQSRWGHLLQRDPAYNRNLSLESWHFDLASPPRH